MGKGTAGSHPELPGVIGNVYGEEAARGFYQHWARMLVTDAWATLYPELPADGVVDIARAHGDG